MFVECKNISQRHLTQCKYTELHFDRTTFKKSGVLLVSTASARTNTLSNGCMSTWLESYCTHIVNVLSVVCCLPAEGMPALVLFENHWYFGRMQVINSSSPDLELPNFDNVVSSFVITGGVWELYSGVNYTGSMVTLGQGCYPTSCFLIPISSINS